MVTTLESNEIAEIRTVVLRQVAREFLVGVKKLHGG